MKFFVKITDNESYVLRGEHQYMHLSTEAISVLQRMVTIRKYNTARFFWC